MGCVIVLGGSGFIGSAVCELLRASGIDFIAPAFDLTASYSSIQLSQVLHNGDTIIMIAGRTQEHGKAYTLTDQNIRMATNVLTAMEGKAISHVVYVSSDSVYGEHEAPLTEQTPLSPVSLYGQMHVIREMMFTGEGRTHLTTLLRPSAVYGAGDTHNAYGINQFIRSALKDGTITLFGDGEERRSVIYIDDVARIIVDAATRCVEGTYNVNCGISYTFKQLAHLVKHHINRPIVILSKPRTLPIHHRDVDNSLLIKHYHEPIIAEIGISRMLEQLND